ncbi:hypothetical protein GGR42_001940 [Saonia flava]|uniref:Uncharacterized protein n=1 Tax=Saonia flava TaxID=523696 RepID=A0A846QTV4_9FLAO|nr:hypothetical protein [Saonia flava]NJB71478.1 hypothetical protein [Saonia flava]
MLFFKQTKPTTVKVLGVAMLLLSLFILWNNPLAWHQAITMSVLGVLLLGYSVTYSINNQFEAWRHFQIFGISVYKSKLRIEFPEYITVFSLKHKQSSDWGPVAAMGTGRKGDSYVIRIFKGNKHFTLYRACSLEKARDKAKELSSLTGIQLLGSDQ